MFNTIRTEKDIRDFLEKTNFLHDGYIVGVQYCNDGGTADKDSFRMNPEATKLILRILVTSLWNTVVEIEFENLLEWQLLQDRFSVILNTSVSFHDNGFVTWIDDVLASPQDLEGCTYVTAKSMKWRISE